MIRHHPRPILGVRSFVVSGLAALLSSGASAAYALPQAPVIAGANGTGTAATFNTSGSTLTVNQLTNNTRVVINWNSFGIASTEHVTFVQPSKSAIAFNVVTGGGPQSILGSLSANGGVWLFSPGGLIFGPNATISTGSFLASTGVFNSTSQSQALNSDSVQIFPQATPGAASIDVQSGATIGANAGFVLLHAPTITQAGSVTASDAVVYNAAEDVQVQFAPSGTSPTDSISLTNESSNGGTPSASHIVHSGTTTAGTWFEVDAAQDVATSPGFGGVINLGGHVSASGMKADTLDPTDKSNGYSVILDGDVSGPNAPGVNSGSSVTTIDASAGTITAASGIIGSAGTIKTGTWTSNGGAVSLLGGGSGGIEVDKALVSNGAGAVDLIGRKVAVDAGITAAGSISILSFSTQVAPGLTVQAGKSIAGSSLILKSTGDISIDPSSSLLVGPSAAAPNGTLSVVAGTNLGPSDAFLVDNNFPAVGGDLSLGAASAGSIALQASPVNGIGGAVTLPGAINAAGSMLIGATQLNLGPNASITAGFTGSATPGAITTNSATANVQVWDTSATFKPTAQTVAGDILIGAPVAISDPTDFAVNAYHSLTVTAPITDSGAGEVDLNTAQGGGGGDYAFVNGGALTFTAAPNSGQSLFINSNQYTLVYSQLDLLNINDPNNGSGGLGGLYALAAPLDLNTSNTATVFTGAPIASTVYTPFTGTFVGLGNTISNLDIQEVTPIGQQSLASLATNGGLGLFGFVAGGTVRDINLSNATVTGGNGVWAGALVGELEGGAVMNASSSGQITVADFDPNTSTGANTGNFAYAVAGGLIGYANGTVVNDSSSAVVSGGKISNVGGLVGMVVGGSISGSSASGSVSGALAGVQGAGANVGGLAGYVQDATIANSSASGSATGGDFTSVGGLVGDVVNGTVSRSFANGAIRGGAGSLLGGFAGAAGSTTITTSYATGAVTQTAAGVDGSVSYAGGFVGDLSNVSGPSFPTSITQSWSSGAVQTVGGADSGAVTLAGGFAGSVSDSSISNSYSLSPVTSTGAFADTGGFAGLAAASSSISGVYATGAVSGGGPVAGLVAVLGNSNEPTPVTSLSNSYWDTGTTGQGVGYHITPAAAIGDGVATATAVVGITGAAVYTAATYANFGTDLTTGAGVWVMIPGATRPMLSSEYSTTITNAHQLQLMELHLGADYTLANDIDASGTSNAAGLAGGLWNPATGFSPIGANGESNFTGVFDGRGHTISGLTITYTTAFPQSPTPGLATDGLVGLFGFVDRGGVIEDVNLANAHVAGGDGMVVGALAAGLLGTADYTSSSGLVTVGNEITSGGQGTTADAGGLVGGSAGLIANSHSSATVAGGDAFAGGLLGTGGSGGLITNSYATGAVSVTAYPPMGVDRPAAGGLVGEFGGSGASNAVLGISGSYATGAVSGGAGSAIGGLIGSVDSIGITNAYATGAVTQTAGGVTGSNSAAGGFVGSVENDAQITNAYASGAVNSQAATTNNFTRAGGFAGEVEGQGTSISNAYALGSVTINGSGGGVSPAGGFAGAIDNDGEVDHVYATGLVTSVTPVFTGGLVGQLGSRNGTFLTSGTVFNSYWDKGTTGQPIGVNTFGSATPPTSVFAVGGGGPSAYATASYANFDLSGVWFMIPGETRPILRSEYSNSITNVHQLELMSLNLGASYSLASNIDASETIGASGVFNPANGFVPVGATAAAPFTGTFTGQGYTITNLTLIGATGSKQTVDGVTTTGAVGLFGFAGVGSAISDVNIATSHASGGDGMSVGLLVGSLSGTVSNATTSGTVTAGNGVDPAGGFANAAAGGLVGSLTVTGSVNFSSSSASVSGGQASVGGLVGEMDGGSVLTSFATGSVTSGAGGAAGTQLQAAGGLVGAALVTSGATPTVTGSYATGAVNAGGSSDAGGFIGLSQGTITASYATGTVTQAASSTTPDLAGGFAGEISGGAVSQSFSTGAVTVSAPSAEAEVGGFVGEVVNGGVITNTYSTSPTSVTGCMSNVGGFAGEILDTSSATDFYATGDVYTNAHGAGLVGSLGGTITNGYWDKGATNQPNGVSGGGGTANNVVGMTVGGPNDPFTQSTYVGFDFSATWSSPSAGVYPQLFGVSHVLQVTASDDTITYGNFPAYTVTATGLQAGDTFASAVQTFQVGPLLNPPGIANSGYYDVGSYGLSVAGVTAAGPNPPSGPYRIIYNDPGANPTNDGGTLFINPAALTISASPDSMTYDGSPQDTGPSSTPSVGGLVPGDSVSATQSYDGANAGPHTLSVDDGYSVTDGNSGNNYTVDASGTADGTIDQLGLDVSLQGTVEKPYDGTTDATLTAANYNFQGGINGDDVSLNIVTAGSYVDQNAGSGKLVTVNGLTLSGDAAGNYFLNGLGSASGNVGIIDKVDLNLSAVGDTKTYDGTTLSGGTPGQSGLVASDTLSPLGQSFTSKDVMGPGCSTLVVNSGYTITELNGTDGSGNYNITTDSAGGTINPVNVVLSANSDTKTYDGGTTSLVSPTLDILYTSAGDTLSATQSFASKDAKGLGGSTLAVDPGYSINDGNSGRDYNVIQVNTASGTINPLALTASLTGSVEKTYDGTTDATLNDSNYSLPGVIGQDDVSLNNPTSGTYDTQNVGSGKTVTVIGLQLSGNDAEDYTVNSSASNTIGIIDQADLTLSAVFDTKTYDGTTFSAGTPGESGLAASDTLGSLSQSFTSKDVVVDGCSTLVVNSGYTITESNGSDGLGNYKITTEQNNGIINPVDVVLSATGDTKTYDGGTTSLASPTLSILYTAAGDKLSATQSFASKDVKGTGGSTLVVDPGYSINDGNGGADYNIIQVNTASGTINPLALTASLTGAVEKTYDGTTDATLGSANYSLSSAIVGDSVSLNDPASGTYDTRNAGTGKTVSVTGLQLVGGDAEDYTVNNTAQASIGIIDRAALTLTAVTDTKTYDGTLLSGATPTHSSLIGGDSISGLTEAYDSRNAGARTLAISGYTINDGNDGGNYLVTTVIAPGTINAAPLTLAAVTATKTYDGTTLSTAMPTESGLVAGDSISGLAESYDSKNAGARTLAVGGYTIQDGAGGANYIVTTTVAPGTIDQKALSASLVGGVSKPFDGNADATLATDNYSLSGIVQGDQVGLNDPTAGTYDTASAGTHKLVSVTGLALSGADAANYTVNGQAAASIGTITAPPQPIVINLPPTDLTSTDFDQVAAFVAGSSSNNTTVVNVFPVGTPEQTREGLGDSSPITGAGNRDLWTGSDETDKSCPPNTPCPPPAGTAP